MNEQWVGPPSMAAGPPTWNDVTMPVSTSVDVLEAPGGRRGVRVPTFVVGLVAVALVAALIGKGLLFGAGGAATPTEAVQNLADALAAEDLAAALTTLAPDEVRDAGDVYASASTKLRNLGVTPEDKTLGGIDLTIDGLRLEEQVLGPDVARVDIVGGTATLAWHTKDMGATVQDLTDEDRSGSESADLADATYHDDAGDERHAFLMVVRRDGGWYVSPFYSVAEYAVSLEGATPGDFGEIQEGPAAGTPSGAVDRLIDAVDRRDLQAGISSLASGEWAVLRAYRAAIEDAIGDADGGSFTIDDWTTSTRTVDDDTALVSIETISGTATSSVISDEQWDQYDDAINAIDPEDWEAYDAVPYPTGTEHQLHWRFADGCLKVDDITDPSASTDTCHPDPESTDPLGMGGMGGMGGFDEFSMYSPVGIVPGIDSAFGDLQEQAEQAAIVVVRDRDGWGISPVATLFRALRTVIDHVDEHTLATITGNELDETPSVELKAGVSTKVALNSAKYAVVGFRATKGVPIVVDTSTGSGASQLRTPGGEDIWPYGPTVPTEDGVLRILIRGSEDTATVTVRELTPTGALELGSTVPVHLDADHPDAVWSIEVPDGQSLQPLLEDDRRATMSIIDAEGTDLDDEWYEDDDATGDPHRLEAGRYTVIVSLDEADEPGEELEPFDTSVRVVDADTVPTFDDYDSSWTYISTIERTDPLPDWGVIDDDDLELFVPPGVTAVIEFSADEDMPVGLMWKCDLPTDQWQDTGDVTTSFESPGTARIAASPEGSLCKVVAVAAEAYVDVDLSVTPG